MALAELKIYSESLGMQTEVYVIIPQKSTSGEIGVSTGKSEDKYKCLYLLHGLSDDHTIWSRRTSIERYAQEYGICVVMPAGGKSFYTDMKYGLKYYTYIAKELPRIINSFFNVSDKREDNFIAGLSMGGYGAIKIGLRECDYFSKVAGISSVCDIRLVKNRWSGLFYNIFGDDVGESDDLFSLAETKKDDKNRPQIFMGVGNEDFLYNENQRLKEHFERLGYELTYRESAGNHNWAFWDEYIQYVLKWMLK